MGRGGAGRGQGRKKKELVPGVADKTYAARVLEALDREERATDPPIFKRFRVLAFAQDMRISLDTLKYLLDKRDGKAVQPMDFGDRPLSVIVDIPSAVTRRAQK